MSTSRSRAGPSTLARGSRGARTAARRPQVDVRAGRDGEVAKRGALREIESEMLPQPTRPTSMSSSGSLRSRASLRRWRARSVEIAGVVVLGDHDLGARRDGARPQVAPAAYSLSRRPPSLPRPAFVPLGRCLHVDQRDAAAVRSIQAGVRLAAHDPGDIRLPEQLSPSTCSIGNEPSGRAANSKS